MKHTNSAPEPCYWYKLGSPSGRVFQRRCIHNHCSGVARIARVVAAAAVRTRILVTAPQQAALRAGVRVQAQARDDDAKAKSEVKAAVQRREHATLGGKAHARKVKRVA